METKRVNEAVKNNSNKFPDDYFFQVTDDEFEYLQKPDQIRMLFLKRVCI